MAGPYPLATLGPTITSTGITIPSYADIYASLQASFTSIYGVDSYIAPDSQDGQMLAILAQGYSDQNNAVVAVYQAFSPSFAQGALLSLLVRINGLTRDVATNSSVVVTIVGTVGIVITNGVVQDTQNNLWNLPTSVTIPIGGSIAVTATAQNVGAIVAPTNSVNTIYTPQLGWASVNNPTYAAVPGAPIESDAALRVRQAKSVSLPALSPLAAIYAAIGQLPGVINWTVYENSSAVTDGNGVPSHSIDVIVEGGDLTQIAQTIYATKSPGTGTYGSTSETVVDPSSGLPETINFDVLTQTAIYVSITTKGLPGFVTTTNATIQAAVSAFLDGLPIGGDVYYTQLYSPAQLDSTGLGETYYITSLTVGTAPSPVGTANIPIAFNAIANCPPANVVITNT
jgi:Baseplate J-like protein